LAAQPPRASNQTAQGEGEGRGRTTNHPSLSLQCADSLCRQSQNVSFSCHFDAHGIPHLDRTSISGSGILFTDECRAAVLPTIVRDAFAGTWLCKFPTTTMENEEQDKNDNDFLAFSVISPSCEWDMINFVLPENVWSLSSDVITSNTTTSSSNGTTGRVVSPDDAVAALLLAGLTPTKGQSVPLMRDSMTNKKKNHRETFAPRHLLCYDDLDADRRAVVDQALPVYDWLLRYYPPLLAWVVYPLIAFFAALSPLVITALFRALVLYPLCSWWAVRSSVTFGSMVRALLLLEIILCPPGWLWIGYLTVLAPLTTVVDPLSPTGGNRTTTTTTTAGLNWLVLFVTTTSLAASSYQESYALLHSLLGNVSFILDGILWLTPGDGWSKMFGLVSIYQHVFLTAPTRPPPSPIQQPLQQDGIKMD
jgi:hypothetical protein